MSALYWLFDLDNTLHHAHEVIFPHLNRRITEYICQHLGFAPEAANALRERYWRNYGATLLGLMRHHGVSARHFLEETHRFEDLAALVRPAKLLGTTLRKLPGPKAVLTNAPRRYAEAVLEALAVTDQFRYVVAIEDLGYHPKPRLRAYAQALAVIGARAAQTIFVEDTAANLAPAKQLGMTTVWISRSRGLPPYVDVKLASFHKLPQLLNRRFERLATQPPRAQSKSRSHRLRRA